MMLETKQNEKARSSPQISGVMVLHHNMVSTQMMSPQNGVTRGGLPPAATPERRHWEGAGLGVWPVASARKFCIFLQK